MHQELDKAFSLEGRVAVLTGAGGGIGRQTAITFAQAGADVVIGDILEKQLDETAVAVRALGREATVVPTDVSKRAAVDDLARAAIDRYGRLDVWANIHGVIRYNLVVDTPDDELDLVLNVNLKGAFYGCAAAARVMTAAGRGSIINVASTGMDGGPPRISTYSMSKAAIHMLTRNLATEVGGSGVRVNTIAPGWVATPMTSVYWTNPDGSVDEDKRKAIIDLRAQGSVLQTVGQPEDMAWAMLYLASDASRFMTGQVLRPNGGVSML